MVAKLCPLKFGYPATPDMNCGGEKCEWWVLGKMHRCVVVTLALIQEGLRLAQKEEK